MLGSSASSFGLVSPIEVMTTEPKRIAWVDYAKGIGIILVVLGHVIGSLNR
jgi:uncharacterized membrane protein YcfT